MKFYITVPDCCVLLTLVLTASVSFVGATGDSATFKLISGGLKLVPGAIARSTPERFIISTPSSLFMVNGSEGSLTLCGDEICDKKGVDEIEN